MKKIYLVTPDQVRKINQRVCDTGYSEHYIHDIGKIESALHNAYCPGFYPFHHGGVAKIAGALAYYIVKAHAFFDGNKRTALLASTIFMEMNGWDLRYPLQRMVGVSLLRH